MRRSFRTPEWAPRLPRVPPWAGMRRPNGAQEQSASILDLLSFIGFSIFLFFKDLHNAIALEGMRV